MSVLKAKAIWSVLGSILFLAACTATKVAPSSTVAVTAVLPTETVFLSETPVSTRTPSPLPSATKRRFATNTPTASPTSALAWNVPAIPVKAWPTNAFDDDARWIDNTSIIVEDQDYSTYTIQAGSGAASVVITATPYVPSFVNTHISRSDHFEVDCKDANLEMFKLPERKLVSQASLRVSDCISVQWANDESAVSIVSDDALLYVWRPDGSAPRQIGSAMPSAWAAWSPNSKKLVVSFLTSVGGEGTFVVYFSDGRPPIKTAAVIDAGNGWEPYNVDWLTDNVVENMRQCGDGGACQYYSYFDATDGKFLIGYMVDGLIGQGQAGWLSPDQRWLALATDLNADVWDQRYDSDNHILAFYDLKNHRKLVWANDDESYYFSGWGTDSHAFYYVRYPVLGASPDSELGLYRIDPFTLKSTSLISNLVSATWNPERRFLFAIVADKLTPEKAGPIAGAVYDADGKRLSPKIPICDSLEFERLNGRIVPVAWSHSGNALVFLTCSGDLWLIKEDGQTQQLASQMATDNWPAETTYKWSPDDSQVLIIRNHQAWVVSILAR